MKVPSTGIVNYREVCAKYVELIQLHGGMVQTGTRVDRLREVNGTQVIETSHGEFEAGFIINCEACLVIAWPALVVSRKEFGLPSAQSLFSIPWSSFYAHDR